jgi:hypothetical protein
MMVDNDFIATMRSRPTAETQARAKKVAPLQAINNLVQ